VGDDLAVLVISVRTWRSRSSTTDRRLAMTMTMDAPLRMVRPRAMRRAGLVAAALLAIGVPAAVAVTTPWSPVLGRPDVDGHIAVSSAPGGAPASSQLAILRRGQTDADRAQAAPLLRTLNERTQGVQLAGVRALGGGWALVPVATVQAGTRSAIANALCLTDGEAIVCQPGIGVAQDGVRVAVADDRGTRVIGVVPDGVAVVRFAGVDGTEATVPVRANAFSFEVPTTGPASTIDAPDGYEHGASVPSPPLPATGEITWLDAAGAVVGPQHPRVG
jgi:hypothetical protein